MNDAQREASARLRRAELLTACEKCGAAIGEECRSSGGNPTLTPHTMRRRRGLSRVRMGTDQLTRGNSGITELSDTALSALSVSSIAAIYDYLLKFTNVDDYRKRVAKAIVGKVARDV